MWREAYPDVVRGAPLPGRVFVPQALSLFRRGLAHYEVAGGRVLCIDVDEGDVVNICNLEGGQICELVAADKQGRIDASILSAPANADASGLLAMLACANGEFDVFRHRLAQHAIDLTQAKGQAIRLFSATTPAKAEENFTISQKGFLIIAAPGEAMAVDSHDTLTPILVKVQQAHPQHNERISHPLPDPLADPLLDLRIHSATAQSYFVRAGEFIQILDVDGRQCTDFQCFSARKLDQGIDNPLDVTATRAVLGHAYPMPGLHAKYYDQDFEALVEVVQDSCLRHDAFALACYAKYYDDIGYPGHVNCSENFNKALEGKGVRPRAGWMAMNFFFNTSIDAHGVMISDETWSRPGDYVLLRALTDIVCVSSACPDDTSPANGWNPTDIHVRTYADSNKFSRGWAHRPQVESEAKMTKQTGFHERLSEHTRDFVEYRGFWIANSFAKGGAIDEYWACREKAVMMDLSALRKFEVTGPDSEALLQYTLTRDIRKLGVGQVVYTAMCYEHGGMIDDGTLLRLGHDNFRWIGGDDYSGIWLREKAAELGLQVLVRSSTDQLHNVAVQGPLSRAILKELIWTPPHQPALTEVDWFRFTIGRINSANGIPVVVSRTGYTGELGYEIWCHPRDATQVFDAVWQAGQPHGLQLMGLQALDMLRIEAGLIFAGYEFSDETDPFEAGIGFTVPLKSKGEDFIGRDALIRRKENPVRKLVGLDIDSTITVGHGDGIYIGRAKIGEVTSSTRSPILKKNIALARLDVTHAGIGTQVEVGKLDGLQKRIGATVVPFAHYDPKKERPRS